MKPSLNLPERGQQSRDLAQEVLQMKSVIQDLEQQLEVSKEDISRRDDTIASLECALSPLSNDARRNYIDAQRFPQAGDHWRKRSSSKT